MLSRTCFQSGILGSFVWYPARWNLAGIVRACSSGVLGICLSGSTRSHFNCGGISQVLIVVSNALGSGLGFGDLRQQCGFLFNSSFSLGDIMAAFYPSLHAVDGVLQCGNQSPIFELILGRLDRPLLAVAWSGAFPTVDRSIPNTIREARNPPD